MKHTNRGERQSSDLQRGPEGSRHTCGYHNQQCHRLIFELVWSSVKLRASTFTAHWTCVSTKLGYDRQVPFSKISRSFFIFQLLCLFKPRRSSKPRRPSEIALDVAILTCDFS